MSLLLWAAAPTSLAAAQPGGPSEAGGTSDPGGEGIQLLSRLPQQTALAIVIRKPGRFALLLREELDRWTRAAVGLVPRVEASMLESALDLRLSPEGLESVGVRPDGPVLALARTLASPVVFRVALSDRRRFEAWLSRLGGGEKKWIPFGRERALVLFPHSDTPAVCVVRVGEALCQVGSDQGKQPAGPLAVLAQPEPPFVGSDAEITAALGALPEEADLLALAEPRAFGELVGRAGIERAMREARFVRGKRAQEALREARARARDLHAATSELRAMAFAFSYETGKARLLAEAVLEPPAARKLARLLEGAQASDRLRKWAETPALASARMALNPEVGAQLLRQMGLELGSAQLSGGLAVLALGLDTECASAKASGRSRLEVLPFILPLAGAVGLTGALRDEPPRQIGPWVFRPDRTAASRWRFRRTGGGADETLEAWLHEGVLLLGAGPGSGLAASRRWAAVNDGAARGPGSGNRDAPFFELRLDLAAISAAVSAGSFGADLRPELRSIRDAHEKLRPVLDSFRSIRFDARREPDGKRLRFEMSAGH